MSDIHGHYLKDEVVDPKIRSCSVNLTGKEVHGHRKKEVHEPEREDNVNRLSRVILHYPTLILMTVRSCTDMPAARRIINQILSE